MSHRSVTEPTPHDTHEEDSGNSGDEVVTSPPFVITPPPIVSSSDVHISRSPTDETAAQTLTSAHPRLTLRVETDTRALSTASSSPTSPSPSSSPSPKPLTSPNSAHRQHNADMPESSPNRKRKPLSASSTASSSSSSSAASSSSHRLSIHSPSPPKSPHSHTPPRSPRVLLSVSPPPSSPRPPSAIRQFYYPLGMPPSPNTATRDTKLIHSLFINRGALPQTQTDNETATAASPPLTNSITPTLRREELYGITTAVCGLSSYCNGALFEALIRYNALLGEQRASHRRTLSPLTLSPPPIDEIHSATDNANATVSETLFRAFWLAELEKFDIPTRIFRILNRQPINTTAYQTDTSQQQPPQQHRYLVRDDFKPIVTEIVHRHPGLEFLESTPEFQFKYAQTVIARIFYAINKSGSEKLLLSELRSSNFVLMMSLLDSEEDINKLNDYFSYEHFYVIYCRFWELDRDHDGLIDSDDLMTYDEFALTNKIIDRVVGGYGRRLLSGVPRKLNYLDFVIFLISEVDKTSDVAIDYWFKCVDLDGDGLITPFEIEYFFDEQKQRITNIAQEQISFEDILCQLTDMIKHNTQHTHHLKVLSATPSSSAAAAATSSSLSSSSTSSVPSSTASPIFIKKELKLSLMAESFFNTLFNLTKFILSEQRDPIRIKQIHDTPQLSPWSRYAIAGYYRLAEVESEADGGADQIDDGNEQTAHHNNTNGDVYSNPDGADIDVDVDIDVDENDADDEFDEEHTTRLDAPNGVETKTIDISEKSQEQNSDTKMTDAMHNE